MSAGRRVLALALVTLIAGASPALAAPAEGGVAPAKEPDGAGSGAGATPVPAKAPDKAPAPPEADNLSHRGQFEVSLRLALGLRAIVPYDKQNYCGQTDNSTSTGNAPVCSGRAPFSFDLELGYGLARRIDVFAELRLGIEADFPATANLGAGQEGPRMLHVSPGARFFFSDAATSKLFTTAQVVFDFAGYKDAAGASRGTDFGVRNLNGLWFDLDKAYGFYAYIGETATFARWLRFELEAGVGIQGRYR